MLQHQSTAWSAGLESSASVACQGQPSYFGPGVYLDLDCDAESLHCKIGDRHSRYNHLYLHALLEKLYPNKNTILAMHAQNFCVVENLSRAANLRSHHMIWFNLQASLGSVVSLSGVLSLGNNAIEELPANLGSLRELQGLDLDNNRLLKALPQSLSSLHQLRYFSCNHCRALRDCKACLPSNLGYLRVGSASEFDVSSQSFCSGDESAFDSRCCTVIFV